jgi:transposase
VQNPTSQDNLPEIGKKIAYKANHEGVAERFQDAAVQTTIEVDLALITYDDARRKDLELSILKTAKYHDAHTLYLLQTIPGLGKILSLVLLYEIHQIDRFPRVQDFASDCRLVKCSKDSGAHAWTPLANKSAMRTASGPVPKLPSCSCEIIPRARSCGAVWRKSMTRVKP